MPEVISRSEAKACGLKRYFTGSACVHGHVAERYISTNRCLACMPTPEENRAKVARYRSEDAVRVNALKREWYQKNRERICDARRRHLPPSPRAKAKESGARYYFAETPCSRGHLSQRLVRNHSCTQCNKEDARRNRERHKTHKQRWVAANRNRIRQASRKRYIEKRDHITAVNQRWATKNIEARRAMVRRHRARKRAADGNHTASDIAAILRSQRHRCAYCRKKLGQNRHIDHIIPVARGGSNDRRNLQALCPDCNLRKSTKMPTDFAREHGLLI